MCAHATQAGQLSWAGRVRGSGLGHFRARKLFPWRTVLWGLGLQFVFALLILKTPWGAAVFDFTGRAVSKLIQFSNEGCQFVFGPLATDAC